MSDIGGTEGLIIETGDKVLSGLVDRAKIQFDQRRFSGEGQKKRPYVRFDAIRDVVNGEVAESGGDVNALFNAVANAQRPFLTNHTESIADYLFQPDSSIEGLRKEMVEMSVWDHLSDRYPEISKEEQRRETEA